MIKRLSLILLVGLTFMASAACSDQRAKDLFDTAQLEERQNSPEHASRLYRELLEKYPDSAHAEAARKRLEALSGTEGQ